MSDGVSFGPHVGGEDGERARLGRLVDSDPDASIDEDEAEVAGNHRLRREFVRVVPGHAAEELEDRLPAIREQIEVADGQ